MDTTEKLHDDITEWLREITNETREECRCIGCVLRRIFEAKAKAGDL